MALASLIERGYDPVPVHPSLKEVHGVKIVNRLEDVVGPVDTVTLYVNPRRLAGMIDAIVSLKPRRVIANPGSESEEMREASSRNGIEYVEACTLVMLSTGVF